MKPEVIVGTRFGIVADAHIHPGKTPPFPEPLTALFTGFDGDMGEASGLDQLETLARVFAVRGEDDQDERRATEVKRLFSVEGVHIGVLFDGVRNGLLASSDPLSPNTEFPERLAEHFGHAPAVLLCASTHKPLVASYKGTLIVNPGSPTLADTRTVASLQIVDGLVRVAVHAL
jgi:putative phosphoesterase